MSCFIVTDIEASKSKSKIQWQLLINRYSNPKCVYKYCGGVKPKECISLLKIWVLFICEMTHGFVFWSQGGLSFMSWVMTTSLLKVSSNKQGGHFHPTLKNDLICQFYIWMFKNLNENRLLYIKKDTRLFPLNTCLALLHKKYICSNKEWPPMIC